MVMPRRSVHPKFHLAARDTPFMLLGLMFTDMEQMRRRGPARLRVRDLIQTGRLRYSRIDPDDHWQTYDEILEQLQSHPWAEADCEDLSGLLAAEMRIEGTDPGARPTVHRTGPHMLHVRVTSPRHGQVLDPSVWAGMGGDESRQGWGR